MSKYSELWDDVSSSCTPSCTANRYGMNMRDPPAPSAWASCHHRRFTKKTFGYTLLVEQSARRHTRGMRSPTLNCKSRHDVVDFSVPHTKKNKTVNREVCTWTCYISVRIEFRNIRPKFRTHLASKLSVRYTDGINFIQCHRMNTMTEFEGNKKFFKRDRVLMTRMRVVTRL